MQLHLLGPGSPGPGPSPSSPPPLPPPPPPLPPPLGGGQHWLDGSHCGPFGPSGGGGPGGPPGGAPPSFGPSSCPVRSRKREGFWCGQPHKVVALCRNLNPSIAVYAPIPGLHCRALMSYTPPARVEAHRPFHWSGCVTLAAGVSASAGYSSPNAVYRYPPRSSPCVSLSRRTL